MSIFPPAVLQGRGCPALTQLLTSRTGSADRKKQNSKSWFQVFPVFDVVAAWNNRLDSALCVRQRKVRRDMLTSPIIPERGRSRSREIYPQLTRSGSRGRSLSVERRGSRNSSESSLVDMEEMAKTLLRWLQECVSDIVHHVGSIHTWLSSKASMSLELFVIAVVTTMNL